MFRNLASQLHKTLPKGTDLSQTVPFLLERFCEADWCNSETNTILVIRRGLIYKGSEHTTCCLYNLIFSMTSASANLKLSNNCLKSAEDSQFSPLVIPSPSNCATLRNSEIALSQRSMDGPLSSQFKADVKVGNVACESICSSELSVDTGPG